MTSQTHRKRIAPAIANGSQTHRETSPEYRDSARGRVQNVLDGSPSIHNVTQVTREAAPEQTVTPADEWMEGFDFEAEVPCQSPGHDHPADILAVFTCPCCGPLPRTICWARWHWFAETPIRCTGCNYRGWRDTHARIVEVLR